MSSVSEMSEIKKPLAEAHEPSAGIIQRNNLNAKELEDKAARRAECRRRLVPKFKIAWAFISFLISLADVTVIIYLSYLHFSHSSDLVAWLMLLPILLNFIGIFTFLAK